MGELSARLSGDCAAVQGALGTRLGYIFQAISIVVIGLAVGLYYSWELTLIAVWAVPVTLAIVFIESRYMTSSEIEEKIAIESATKVAIEAISNIKTVNSFGMEKPMIASYNQTIDEVTTMCMKKVKYRGLVYSLGQSTPMLGYALALWYGGMMVSKFEIEYDNVVK